jgi:hypothetical protein
VESSRRTVGASAFINWFDGARIGGRPSRFALWRRPPKAYFPADFPVPHGARPVPSDDTEERAAEVDTGEACARWDLDGEQDRLETMLTFALRRRGYAVTMTTPRDTLHEGATLAVSRGTLRGLVSWSRLGARGDGPLRVIATFESR